MHNGIGIHGSGVPGRVKVNAANQRCRCRSGDECTSGRRSTGSGERANRYRRGYRCETEFLAHSVFPSKAVYDHRIARKDSAAGPIRRTATTCGAGISRVTNSGAPQDARPIRVAQTALSTVRSPSGPASWISRVPKTAIITHILSVASARVPCRSATVTEPASSLTVASTP